MANILVTYADDAFINSAWRLKLMARRLGFFDKICIYTPAKLPEQMRQSPLMSYAKGGGFWSWKPVVIADALEHADEGDVVYYIDSGCVLYKSADWERYASLMREYDCIFFHYRKDQDYGWSRYGIAKTELKHWIKPAAADYFMQLTGGVDFLEQDISPGGFVIVKKNGTNNVIEHWRGLVYEQPFLFCDPDPDEAATLPPYFNCHRHDQALLTPLIHHYKNLGDKVLVLPETIESHNDGAGVKAERYKVGRMGWLATLKYKLVWLLKKQEG